MLAFKEGRIIIIIQLATSTTLPRNPINTQEKIDLGHTLSSSAYTAYFLRVSCCFIIIPTEAENLLN